MVGWNTNREKYKLKRTINKMKCGHHTPNCDCMCSCVLVHSMRSRINSNVYLKMSRLNMVI